MKDSEVAYDDRPGAVDASYIARLCADDWGMFHDVVTSIDVCERMMDDFELSDADRARIVLNGSRLVGALDSAPKTLALAAPGARRHAHPLAPDRGGAGLRRPQPQPSQTRRGRGAKHRSPAPWLCFG